MLSSLFFLIHLYPDNVLVPQGFDSCLAPQSGNFASHAGVFNLSVCLSVRLCSVVLCHLKLPNSCVLDFFAIFSGGGVRPST